MWVIIETFRADGVRTVLSCGETRICGLFKPNGVLIIVLSATLALFLFHYSLFGLFAVEADQRRLHQLSHQHIDEVSHFCHGVLRCASVKLALED